MSPFADPNFPIIYGISVIVSIAAMILFQRTETYSAYNQSTMTNGLAAALLFLCLLPFLNMGIALIGGIYIVAVTIDKFVGFLADLSPEVSWFKRKPKFLNKQLTPKEIENRKALERWRNWRD